MKRMVWIAIVMLLAGPARAGDRLLDETVGMTGALLFLDLKVPGLVIGVVRGGGTSVAGFGEVADGSGRVPDGDTAMRIGSGWTRCTGWTSPGTWMRWRWAGW